MDIIFKGRHTDVQERFREFATAKLARVEKLDQKAIRVDVELSTERNPRQSGRKERVELTITTRGPAIRAEAAAEDRFAALDMALARLEGRLRRSCDRRKSRHGGHAAVRLIDLPEAADEDAATLEDVHVPTTRAELAAANGAADEAAAEAVVRIDMQGDGPLVVRQKFHAASPMTIDQALFEMELVGHDFFLFQDADGGMPSVVYRRRGYQYGVIRLVEEPAERPAAPSAPSRAQPRSRSNGQLRRAGNLA